MNHQTFEYLILKDEPLLLEEAEQLKQHLAQCESCSQLSNGWKAVEWQLDHPVLAAPAEGFANRWMSRLEVERRQSHRRQNTIFITLSLVAVVLLSLGILFISLPLIQSPEILFWTYLERLLSFAVMIDILKDLTLSLYITFGQQFSENNAWITYMPIGMIFLSGMVFEFLVLWFVSLRWITRPRRIVL